MIKKISYNMTFSTTLIPIKMDFCSGQNMLTQTSVKWTTMVGAKYMHFSWS